MSFKKVLFTIVLAISVSAFSQDEDLKIKLDSIVQEADLLYNYEKVAWNSSDLFMASPMSKNPLGGYVVYHKADTVYASFLDAQNKNVIASYKFSNSDLEKPVFIGTDRPINDTELELFVMKSAIIQQLSDPKYKITIPQGYSPNVVLFKKESGYRMYIIMGVMQPGVIPFGNDFMFETDADGAITTWRKYHSSVIPAQIALEDGSKVISAVHSHLKSTPLITATDICTFRLYTDANDMQSFMVLSSALGKYFTYNRSSNSIEITTP